MSVRTLLLILLSVSLASVAQLTLKAGMSSAKVLAALADSDRLNAALAIGTAPLVILGLALYGIGAVAWLFVLARTELSVAYPFVGLSFIVTTILAVTVFGEHVGVLRGVGTLLIACGLYFVAVG